MSFPDDESNNEIGEYKVICGRSSRFSNHIGNRYFHGLIYNSLQTYSDASRWGKTVLISAIVDQVRQKPNGGFVRRDPLCGTKSRYVEVDDYHARKKTSQAFRDALREKEETMKPSNMNQNVEKLSGNKRKSYSAPSSISHENVSPFNSSVPPSNLRALLSIDSTRRTNHVCGLQDTYPGDPSSSSNLPNYLGANLPLQGVRTSFVATSSQNEDRNVTVSEAYPQHTFLEHNFTNYLNPVPLFAGSWQKEEMNQSYHANRQEARPQSQPNSRLPSSLLSFASYTEIDGIPKQTIREALEKACSFTSLIQSDKQNQSSFSPPINLIHHGVVNNNGSQDMLENLEFLCANAVDCDGTSDPFEPNPIGKMSQPESEFNPNSSR